MKRTIWNVLHLVLWVVIAVVAASQFALPVGVFAAAAGTTAGVLTGARIAPTRLRGSVLLASCAGSTALALLLRVLLVGFPEPANALGPGAAYAAADAVLWLLLPFSVVTALEAFARRRPAFRVLELGLAGWFFAALFAAHRQGFIDRPFAFVDPLWSRGKDPLGYFLLLGAALTIALVLMLARGTAGKRSAAGLLTLVVLIMGLFLMLPQGKLKNVVELHRVMGDKGREKGERRAGKSDKERDRRPDDGRRTGRLSNNGDPGLPESFSDQKAGESNAPVAVVVFHSDFKPPLGYYYFRETAFSTFNGERLVRDTSGRYDRDVATGFAMEGTDLPSAGLPYGTSEIPGLKGEAFTRVPTTVALMAPHPRPFGLVNPARIAPAPNPDPRRFFRAYSVISSALVAPLSGLLPEKAGGRSWSSAAWRHYTAGPSDPRYGALADRIVSELPARLRDDPFARAVAIKLWLDKHGTYSLTSNHGASADPVSDFLFGNITGHCVYFAHAACLLYRAAGVPSRVAAGYAVRASFMGGGSSLLIRSRDAHAWPEICLRQVGWIPLDISPAKTLAPPEQAPDQGLQQMLGGMVKKARRNKNVPPEEPTGPSFWTRLKHWLEALFWVFLVLLAVMVPVSYGVKLWRRWIPYARGRRLPVTSYRASLDLLAEAGIRRGFGEAREAFASRVARHSPAFAALTLRHLRHALGGRRSEDDGDCLGLYRDVRGEIRKASRPLVRWLGILNPVSWWRVR